MVNILAITLNQKEYSVYKELTITCLMGNRRADIFVVKEGMGAYENHKMKAMVQSRCWFERITRRCGERG